MCDKTEQAFNDLYYMAKLKHRKKDKNYEFKNSA